MGNQSLRQPLTVEVDPRVHASPADLADQLSLAQQIGRGMKVSSDAFYQVSALRKALTGRTDALKRSETKETKDGAADLEKKIKTIDQGTKAAPGFGPLNRDLARIIFAVESADTRPADTVRSAVQQACEALNNDLVNWRHLNEQELPAFNQVLAANQLAPLPALTGIVGTGCSLYPR